MEKMNWRKKNEKGVAHISVHRTHSTQCHKISKYLTLVTYRRS